MLLEGSSPQPQPKNEAKNSYGGGHFVPWRAGVTYSGHPLPEKHTGKECNLRTWDKPSSIKNTLPKGVTESYGYSQYFSESETLLPKLEYR